MKKLLLLFLVCGCVGFNSMSTGSSVFENFCGDNDYAILGDKGERVESLVSDSDVVIAVRNSVTGSIVLLGEGGDSTYAYLPEEVGQDDFLIFVDKGALDKAVDYCDYTVAVNKRTNDFYIINTTKMNLLD